MDGDEGNNNKNNINASQKIQRIAFNEQIDSKYGFNRHSYSTEKIGWLINFQSVQKQTDNNFYLGVFFCWYQVLYKYILSYLDTTRAK